MGGLGGSKMSTPVEQRYGLSFAAAQAEVCL